MNLVNDFPTFERSTRRRALEIYERTGRSSQLAGIILSPVQNNLVEEIARSLDYWHIRSGGYFDLYWAGFSFWVGNDLRDSRASRKIATSMALAHQVDRNFVNPPPPVGINHEAFSRFVDELNHRLAIAHSNNGHRAETTTSEGRLYYPGGTELLLIDVDYDPALKSQNARIRYSRSVWINLDKLSATKPNSNLQTLIEDIRPYSSTDIDDLYVRDWLKQSGYVDDEMASSLSWRSACYGLWRLRVLASDVVGVAGLIGQIHN
ncbi:MAG: hypothetical protein QM589_13350 [Thermomicrobiales bacterium]